METYTPISCSYYDRLEAWATRKDLVAIEYQNNDQVQPQEAFGQIVDLYMKDKVEYLRLEDGVELRLDWLRAVNGIPVPNVC